MDKFAIIFDMDGVIIDSNQFHKQAWREFCNKHGFDLPEDELKKNVYGKKNSEILKYLFKKKLTSDEEDKYAEEKERIFRQKYKEDIQPMKGLVDFLEIIEKNNIPHAIATSAPPENVEFTLSELKIEEYFKYIVDDSMVEMGKPDPEVYLKTAEMLNFKPEDCIVIEDSLSGIMSAKDAGMKVIGITTTHLKEELNVDLVIDDFTELNIKKIELIMKK